MQTTLISCANTSCGIGRYSEELSKAFVALGMPTKGYRKTSANEVFNTYPYRSLKNLRHYIAPFYLNKAIKHDISDIWHADYVDAAFAVSKSILQRSNARLFTTVHDGIPFLYPQSNMAFWMYKKQLKHAAKISEKLIVVSHKSKSDLVKYAGILPERIEVVYNGVNHDQFFPSEQQKVNDRFTIRYFGGLGGYKNVESIIHTAKIVQDMNLDVVFEIGGSHPESTPFPALVESLNLKNVVFKGFIPDHELQSFLADADLFIFPSLYEGFGLPPLEAMACGTATIASNRGSLQEVLKWGALTMEPKAENFAEAIRDLYLNPSKVDGLARRAILRANNFTWEKAAIKTAHIYGVNLKSTSRKVG